MLSSPRLTYEPLALDHLDRFHSLVQDDHIRRYLMDGELLPREWSEERVRQSQDLVSRRGVGCRSRSRWRRAGSIGFCGFLEIPTVHEEPQLVYALLERFTGQGYATEMARAAIADARARGGFSEIIAAVDAVNAASVVCSKSSASSASSTLSRRVWRYVLLQASPVSARFLSRAVGVVAAVFAGDSLRGRSAGFASPSCAAAGAGHDDPARARLGRRQPCLPPEGSVHARRSPIYRRECSRRAAPSIRKPSTSRATCARCGSIASSTTFWCTTPCAT